MQAWTVVAWLKMKHMCREMEELLNSAYKCVCIHDWMSVCIFRISSAASLVHRGRVELEGMLHDVVLHVVFTLIYDIGIGVGGRSDMTTRRVL